MTIGKLQSRLFRMCVVALVPLALALPAYGASSQGLTKLNIAIVPVLDAEPLLYAQSQGYYKDAGLDVTFSSNDAGSAVVSGVVNGTYDAAAAAWFPIAIAISKGVPLRYMMNVSAVDKGDAHANCGVVVKPDSGINDYTDLEGKSVAVNALTSLTTLVTRVMMEKNGADPDKVKFVSLPFKASVQAVAQGHVDAAIAVDPFQAVAKQAGLKVLGDPIEEAQPQRGSGLVMFTSKASAKSKKDAMAAFVKATFRAAEDLKGDVKLQRKIAHTVIGLPEDIAKVAPLPYLATQPIHVDALQAQLDLADQYGYLKKPLEAKKLILNFDNQT